MMIMANESRADEWNGAVYWSSFGWKGHKNGNDYGGSNGSTRKDRMIKDIPTFPCPLAPKNPT